MALDELRPKEIAGRRVWLTRDDRLLQDMIVEGESRLRAGPGAVVVRENVHVLVMKVQVGGEAALYWKSFHPVGLLERLKDLFRPCAAARAWRGSLLLQGAGVATAPVVAYGEPGRSSPSFVITEELVDALSVKEWLNRFHEAPAEWAARKHRLMRRMGELPAALHKSGLYHTDMRPGNIFARLNDAGNFDMSLIDTDRVLCARLRGRRESRRNLMQMMFCLSPEMTMTDRMRIADAYVRARGLTPTSKARRKIFLNSCRWVRSRLRALAAEKTSLRAAQVELLKRLERLP